MRMSIVCELLCILLCITHICGIFLFARTVFTANIGIGTPEKLLKIKTTDKKPSLHRREQTTSSDEMET